MTELINKITSYNLFNYLVPGVLFAAFADFFTSYPFIQEDLLVGAFVYYFLGLIISRFGSLIIEPFLKKLSFIKFAPYNDFLSAAKVDPKIDLLSEENNMYRTFIALFVLLGLLKIYDFMTFLFQIPNFLSQDILICALLWLFLYSYKKQTDYITERIKVSK